jgi:hypothetical protein
MVVLLDWLEDGDDREFQAAALAVAMVTKVNQLVAKRKNRGWNHFTLTEAEVGAMVADLLVDSHRFGVDAAFLSIEHLGGHRRDHLRQAIDFCVVPRRIC